MVTIRILAFIFLLSFFACVNPPGNTELGTDAGVGDCNENIRGLKTKKVVIEEGGNCIVLCDFSSSVDSISVGFIKARAYEIFENFYCKSAIQFYTITNASTSPFYQSEEIAIVDSSKITKAQNAKLEKCLALKLTGNKVELQSALENAFKFRIRATYIIQSLENAINIISVRDPGHIKKNVIFLLSDMKESGTSSLGTFNLDTNPYEMELQKLRTSQEKVLSPQLLKSIEIRIGFYSSNPKNIVKLEQFWDLMFRKIGFPKGPPMTSQVKTIP